jgi:hypothetical protein
MPQSYLDYLDAYICMYSKQVPASKSIGSALGSRRAMQGDPPEECWKVTAQVALLAAETEPVP